jgi:hypothetical protein
VSRRARVLQSIFFLAALGVLLWLLNKVGWSNIGQALVRVGPGGAAVLIALGFAETILDSIAMTIAIGQRRWGRVLFFNNIGSLMNQVLPFDLGEVVKAGFTHRAFPSGTTIAGAIVWNYAFKISRPLVTLGASAIGLIAVKHVDPRVRFLILAGAVLAFAPYVLLRLVLRRGAAAMMIRFLRWVRIVRRDPERILAKALEIDVTVANFWRERPRAFLATLYLQIGARIVSWGSLYATLRVLGAPISVIDSALLYAAMNTADLLITLVPARLGVSEGAAFGIFKICGLRPEIGVIMYVVFRLRSLATTGVLAPFAFLPVRPEPGEPRPPLSGSD